MNGVKKTFYLLSLVILLTGCMRTEQFNAKVSQELPENIQRVQTALDEYQKGTPVFPLKKAPASASLYQKYIIDFSKMKNVLSEPPATSFEKGGHYIYVIADPGKKPQVRVMDLWIIEQVRKLQAQVDARLQDRKSLPKGEKVGKNLYLLDFKILGQNEEQISSPYSSQQKLPVLVDGKGKIYLDYRVEVMQKLEKEGKQPKEKDLRELLYRDSYFVPVFSPAIYYEKGDPVLRAD